MYAQYTIDNLQINTETFYDLLIFLVYIIYCWLVWTIQSSDDRESTVQLLQLVPIIHQTFHTGTNIKQIII